MRVRLVGLLDVTDKPAKSAFYGMVARAPGMIRTAPIYGRPATGGTRVLVTRYWPRGFGRGAFDVWARALSPSADLLKRYRAGMPWAEFEIWYRAEMCSDEAKAALADVRRLAGGRDVILLCYEPDGQNCHRNILLDMLTDTIQEVGSGA